MVTKSRVSMACCHRRASSTDCGSRWLQLQLQLVDKFILVPSYWRRDRAVDWETSKVWDSVRYMRRLAVDSKDPVDTTRRLVSHGCWNTESMLGNSQRHMFDAHISHRWRCKLPPTPWRVVTPPSTPCSPRSISTSSQMLDVVEDWSAITTSHLKDYLQ